MVYHKTFNEVTSLLVQNALFICNGTRIDSTLGNSDSR